MAVVPRVRRRPARIGDFFSDVGSSVSDAASAVANVITHPADAANAAAGAAWTIVTHPADDAAALLTMNIDDYVTALAQVPGFSRLTPTLQDFIDGPLRDFAKSDTGSFLLNVFASAQYAALVPFLGPQFAAVAFATPGFFAGDSFSKAWVGAFADRVQQTAKVMSAGGIDLPDLNLPDVWGQLPTSVQDALTNLSQTIINQVAAVKAFLGTQTFDMLEKWTYDALAKQLQTRVDAAAYALANARGNADELAQLKTLRFDPATGDLLPTDAATHISSILQQKWQQFHTPVAPVLVASAAGSILKQRPTFFGAAGALLASQTAAAAAPVAKPAVVAAAPAPVPMPRVSELAIGVGAILRRWRGWGFVG